MKIEVWKSYSGNRAKKPINEGIYNDDDPRIQGLAVFLIDNGNARTHTEIETPKAPRPNQRPGNTSTARKARS